MAEADRPLTTALLRIVEFLRTRPEIEASLCFETSDKPFDHIEYHQSNLSEARSRIEGLPSFDDFFVRKGDWFIDEPDSELDKTEDKENRKEKSVDQRDACEYVKHCLNIVKETLDVISSTGQQSELKATPGSLVKDEAVSQESRELQFESVTSTEDPRVAGKQTFYLLGFCILVVYTSQRTKDTVRLRTATKRTVCGGE